MDTGTWQVKVGLAQMLKGGVIMDVVTAEHAKIAEDAGACAVMALERVPADIRAAGGVARMSDPTKIIEIMEAVTIPVMAKCRIGHFVEAQVLESLGVDYIDESEVLTPADETNHVWKHDFKVPFVCGCRDLGEALRRISEGAAMIRTKGEAGTGNIVEAVRHARSVMGEIRKIQNMSEGRAGGGGQGAGCTRGAGAGGEAPGAAAGGQLRSGRCGDSRRQRADDAARRGRRVRGLGRIQGRRSGAGCQGRCEGGDPLQQSGDHC